MDALGQSVQLEGAYVNDYESVAPGMWLPVDVEGIDAAVAAMAVSEKPGIGTAVQGRVEEGVAEGEAVGDVAAYEGSGESLSWIYSTEMVSHGVKFAERVPGVGKLSDAETGQEIVADSPSSVPYAVETRHSDSVVYAERS